MKRVVAYALDRLLVASIAAVIVLIVQYAWHPQGTTAATARPVATARSAATTYPVTVGSDPTMTFDSSAALASLVVETSNRERCFELAFERDLHNHDHTFHLTHEFIDGRNW